MPSLPPSKIPSMPDFNITTEGIEKLLLKINTSKAIGPDQIPNQILKIAAQEIAPVLRFIFQQSLDTGDLPLDWRKANISPIYKKGSKTVPANYRPVSLTSNCCKLLEHIIDSQIMRHFAEHNIIAENQHAFRKARSCESQLILTAHDLTKNMDNKLKTDMAVLDFSKAFDVMPHHRLLLKLDHYGVRSKTQKWICSFRTKRFQRVVVNGVTSVWQPVLSGAPQGTVLGPHLFLVLINDIHENVESCTRLFADDCLLYNTIESPGDEAVLQRDLDKMVSWADKWGMRFNPAKCNTLRLTRDRNPGHTNYEMMGTVLEETKETKYLGIFLQNDLRWNRQTQFATGKATRVLNFVRRNFYHVSPVVKERLYHTLVRPHLDHATAAWDPHTSKNIKSIERVQKRAARFVTNTYGKDTSIRNILAFTRLVSFTRKA